VAQQAIEKCARFKDPTIACLGLTFKANVDDIRESPALHVVELIAKALPDVELLLADPFVHEMPDTLQGYDHIRMSRCREAIAAADIVIELVDHDQFRSLSRSLLSGKVVYDTRGVWR
jgi:UDP-N-acetyl-D-mannosaminuronic acid dehydrogenase